MRVILVLLAVAWMAWGQEPEPGAPPTLKGIKEIALYVEIPSDLQGGALSERQIQTDIELSFRKAGLHVVSMYDIKNTPNQPTLEVVVNSLLVNEGAAYAFYVRTDLQEYAPLPRLADGGKPWAIRVRSWGRLRAGLAPIEKSKAIRALIMEFTDDFLNVWLAANGK